MFADIDVGEDAQERPGRARLLDRPIGADDEGNGWPPEATVKSKPSGLRVA
jgi:hypothetical protein